MQVSLPEAGAGSRSLSVTPRPVRAGSVSDGYRSVADASGSSGPTKVIIVAEAEDHLKDFEDYMP
jgi:hypothetical protein